ncbi:hypothetical protein NSK_008395 [Nannochloropsis salina CCMP1776]|uniref:Succinate dehydrogenase cytochrome b560 subunit, mitochondrial n=1 Tax=Nannochloropsis salina CCMP1776 TaxID=1027361 RepID=A0A4D9CMA8_9STRA|nr:hypothetical protein NSK_008395 [Nannochloropsis salina CCMP1776]|eukprot:TFJ80252.1 hypothetical protein NSK_008395 [Nannochloropsis salina CCMP1776]
MILRTAAASSRKAVACCMFPKAALGRQGYTKVQVLQAAYLSTASKETYTERQARTGRPVSPHVTIYKFPITALTSISTRVTGGVLTVGLTGISLLALGGADVPMLMSSLGNSMVGVPAKVLFGFPLIFHYGSGLRHFFWDNNPNFLNNKGVAEASYILLGSTVAISLVSGFVTLAPSSSDGKK